MALVQNHDKSRAMVSSGDLIKNTKKTGELNNI
jgi:hypothetical protein